MATAIPVAEPSYYAGPARTFKVEPALRDPLSASLYDYVTVCSIERGGPRIEVYGCGERGVAIRMNPLPGSTILQHGVSLDDACAWALLTAGGYEIGDWVVEEVPTPEEPAVEDGAEGDTSAD